MDIVRFQGRLGNQMFQYAFMRMLISKGREVAADIKCYGSTLITLQKVFPNIDISISDSIFDENDYFRFIDYGWYETKNCLICQTDLYMKAMRNHNSIYWDGYWQTEKHFADVADEIKSLYDFRNMSNEALLFGKKMAGKTGVHIRRTDYVGTPMEVCSIDYYINAMEFIKKRNPETEFVIFSDDIPWTKEILDDENLLFVDSSEFNNYVDSYDMFFMTLCDNLIISNSSFSWWGAWLNRNEDKIIIAPKKWYVMERNYDEMCPADWIRL